MISTSSLSSKCVFAIVLILSLFSCKQNVEKQFDLNISTNPEIIAQGESVFSQKCSSCHNFNQDAIGPNLSGLTKEVKTEWIKSFISNPQKLIDTNDDRAKSLMNRYQVPMPSFEMLSDSDLDALISYINTYGDLSETKGEVTGALVDPIPDSMAFSDLVAEVEFIAQIPASSEKSPLARINKIECEKNSGRLFIHDLRGILYELKGNEISKYLSLNSLEEKFIDEPGLGTGFGSFAFHPDFQENGLLYTTHSEPSKSAPADFAIHDSIPTSLQWVLKEWHTENPDAVTFEGTSRELLRVDFYSTIHGMQEIAFNPTATKTDADYGKLYICLGDGASVENGFQNIAHHSGNGVWSSILRIDPLGKNSKNGRYGIPTDNPFAMKNDKVGEVWAYGFRNPNKIAWDRSGRLLTSDIGHLQIEEVNVVEAGKFYGWPIREGAFEIRPDDDMSQVFELPENDIEFGVTYPLLQYDHSDGAAISGGYVGQEKTFAGKLIFGDIPTGHLYISDMSQTSVIEKLKVRYNDNLTHFKKIANTGRVDLRLGQDCEGNIYIFIKADGKVYRIINS